jgi:hypothetical protein
MVACRRRGQLSDAGLLHLSRLSELVELQANSLASDTVRGATLGVLKVRWALD